MDVRQHAVDRDLPPRQIQSPFALAAALTLSVLVPLAASTAAEWVFSPTVSTASAALLVFVAVTASVALGTALSTDFTLRTLLTDAASVVVLAFGYVALLQMFTAALDPATTINAAPAWLLALPAFGLIAVQLLSRNPHQLLHLGDLIYTRTVTTTLPRQPAVPRPPVTTGVLS